METAKHDDDDLLERAIHLLHQDERVKEAKSDPEQLGKLADELGIPREYLARAAKAREAEQATRRRRWGAFGAALILVVLAGIAGWVHKQNENAAIEQQKIAELRLREAAARDKLAHTVELAVICTREGQPEDCPEARASAIRQLGPSIGIDIVPSKIDQAAIRSILAADVGTLNLGSGGEAGRIAVVRYEATLLPKDDQFVYANCTARAVVVVPALKRVLQEKDWPAEKGGHVEANGAVEKACGAVHANILAWAATALR